MRLAAPCFPTVRVLALEPKMLERYWHLCPDFVIEFRSQTDRLRVLREKMREWIDNGAQIAWLIDPESRLVEIYRPDGSVELLTNPESVKGEGFSRVSRSSWCVF